MTEAEIKKIELGKLVPNKYNPRKRMTKKHLASLKKSMKEDGQLQTLLVRPTEGAKYEVVAGMRRFHVLNDLHSKNHKVPCTVREMDDEIAMMLAYKENMEREQLSPMDDAGWFFEMLELKTEQLFSPLESGTRPKGGSPLPGESNPQVAALGKKLNISPRLIRNRLPLLALPSELQDLATRTFFDNIGDDKSPMRTYKAEAIARLRLIGDKDEAHKHMKDVWKKWGNEDTEFINQQVTKVLEAFKQEAEAVLRELETTEKNLEKRVKDLNGWIDKDISSWLNPKEKKSLYGTFPMELSEEGIEIPQMPSRSGDERLRDFGYRVYEELGDFAMAITRSDFLEERRNELDIKIDKLQTGRRELEDHTCTYCGTEVKEDQIRKRIDEFRDSIKEFNGKVEQKDKTRDAVEKLRRELGLFVRRFDDVSGDYTASLEKLLKADKLTKEEYEARLDRFELRG
jgi:ParB-like chromosome segregation protein Spo0J